MSVCNFCDQWGSAAYAQNLAKPLSEQIESVMKTLRERRGAEKFLVYFQAYTTSFANTAKLRAQFELALSYPDVVGLVIGTRPDTLSDAFLDVCADLSGRTFVGLELGVQSLDDAILAWMRRGHTAAQSLRAIERVSTVSSGVNLGVHLIFGAPGETDEGIVGTARALNERPVHNVKLHHLHVLKNTPLADEYARGAFAPVTREEYFRRCALFLRELRPDIAVHRLSALSSRHEELVAPGWSAYKMETYQAMLDYLRAEGITQGQAWR